MAKKILLFIIIGILLISFVSATEWDNLKIYNKGEEKITLYNWNVIGLLFNIKLAEYTLTYNTDQCLINCYAEGTVKLYQEERLFSSLEFKDKNGKVTNIKENKIYLGRDITTEKIVVDYKEVCKKVTNVNGTCEKCFNEKIGEHTETRTKIEWGRYNGKILEAGEYYWRIEGTKDKAQSVDWITTAFGKELDNWAWWDVNWIMKKEINITENSGITFANYSVSLNLSVEGSMYGVEDLRFLNSSETGELDHWVESNTTTDIFVYVKVPVLTGGSDTQIYVYYGNAVASSTSDITEAFLAGTGCEYDDPYTSGWTQIGTANLTTTNEWSYSGEKSCFLDSTGAGQIAIFNLTSPFYATTDFENNISLFEVRVRPNVTGSTHYPTIFNDSDPVTTSFWLSSFISFWSGTSDWFWSYDESGHNMGGDVVNEFYHSFAYSNFTSYQTNWTLINSTNDIIISAEENNTITGHKVDAIRSIAWYTYTGDGWIDNIILRKYVNPIPSYVIGGEETGLIPPTVTLYLPTNNSANSTNNIGFNCSATDSGFIQNISLYINGGLNYTVIDGVNNFTELSINRVLADGNYNWTCNAYDDLNAVGNTSIRFFSVNTTPSINFTAPTPINYINISFNSILVNVSLTETYFKNVTFFLFNLTGEYDKTTYTNTVRFVNWSGLVDGKYNYNVTTWTTTGTRNSTETREFTVDTTNPTIIDATNITNLTTLLTSINSTWQFNATDPTLQTCFYNTSDTSAIRIVTCNSTITGTNWTTSGNKMIYYYANDSAGNEAYKNNSLVVRLYSYLQATNKTYITEGKEAYFNLTLDVFNIPVTATATLWHNYTVYSPTTIQVGTNQSNFSVTITIPDEIGTTTGANATWFWEYDLTDLAKANTSLQNQTVYSLQIDNCSTYTIEIVNFSLMDEETNTILNSSLFNTTIEVDITLTSGIILESYSTTFTNLTGARLCIPSGLLDDPATEYLMDIVIRYLGDTYVEEFYYIDDEPISNTTIPEYIYLRDLLIADSQSFVVSFKDEDGILVEDAIIYLLRKYIGDGIFREVESGKTDNAGETILHFVEEDVIYIFNVTKDGVVLWTSEDYRVYCAVAPCELDLSAIGVVPDFPDDWDRLPEGTYSVTSDQSTRIVTLSFNLNETAEMNLTVYEYSHNATIMSTPIDSGILTASSGSIDVTVPWSYGNRTYYAVVQKDDAFVGSHWVALQESVRDYFDDWVLFLVGLIILSLGLMAISTGVGMIVFALLGIVMASILQILDISYAVLIFIVVAGGILIWKVIARRGD